MAAILILGGGRDKFDGRHFFLLIGGGVWHFFVTCGRSRGLFFLERVVHGGGTRRNIWRWRFVASIEVPWAVRRLVWTTAAYNIFVTRDGDGIFVLADPTIAVTRYSCFPGVEKVFAEALGRSAGWAANMAARTRGSKRGSAAALL